jgi:Icc-related predicted phosphoesterase
MPKLIFISDTHTHHESLNESLSELYENHPDSILIHSGDISYKGNPWEVERFVKWYSNLSFKYKIFISGNHDFLFEDNGSLAKDILADLGNDLIYLEDSEVEIDGLKFWGSPVTPWFHNWAFNRFSEIKNHWDLIPADTNILITHGPPKGILDRTKTNLNVGCPILLEKIKTLKSLKVHAFGHIHESWGVQKLNEVHFINSSVLDFHYEVKNLPVFLTL